MAGTLPARPARLFSIACFVAGVIFFLCFTPGYEAEESNPARPSPRRAVLRMARRELQLTLFDRALELTTCWFHVRVLYSSVRLELPLPPPPTRIPAPHRQFSTSSAPSPVSINSETKSTTPEEKSAQVSDPRVEELAEEYKTIFNSTRRVRKAVWDAAPDVFERLSPYLDSHKSPCFRDALHPSQIKCLPYFSIAGVSKCGTTDIYNKMIKLPGFHRVRIKGPHFWDQSHRTATEYLALYDKLAVRSQRVACDASTATFSISPFGVRGHRSPEVSMAEVLKAVQPQSKIVVMVRNPVDRMYSAYYYYGCGYGAPGSVFSPQKFHGLASRSVRLLKECLQTKSDRECVGSLYFKAEQLVKGMYAASLPDWLEHYDSESLLMFRTEDYQKDGRGYMLRVLDFIGIDRPDDETLDAALDGHYNEGNRKRDDVTGCDSQRRPMLRETRAMLEDFYKPHNARLAQLMGDDGYLWEPTAAGV